MKLSLSNHFRFKRPYLIFLSRVWAVPGFRVAASSVPTAKHRIGGVR